MVSVLYKLQLTKETQTKRAFFKNQISKDANLDNIRRGQAKAVIAIELHSFSKGQFITVEHMAEEICYYASNVKHPSQAPVFEQLPPPPRSGSVPGVPEIFRCAGSLSLMWNSYDQKAEWLYLHMKLFSMAVLGILSGELVKNSSVSPDLDSVLKSLGCGSDVTLSVTEK
ncbi:hypothetical protein H671_1g0400 [Cricetulus griseus]|nr:hypothetical protein H671_1g0400 [Cricetulus griseus]